MVESSRSYRTRGGHARKGGHHRSLLFSSISPPLSPRIIFSIEKSLTLRASSISEVLLPSSYTDNPLNYSSPHSSLTTKTFSGSRINHGGTSVFLNDGDMVFPNFGNPLDNPLLISSLVPQSLVGEAGDEPPDHAMMVIRLSKLSLAAFPQTMPWKTPLWRSLILQRT